MRSYLHKNSSDTGPTLDATAIALYRAIRGGYPVVVPGGHTGPATLRLVAERLACDEAAHELRRLGVTAEVVESHDATDRAVPAPLYCGASVVIFGPVFPNMTGLDAEAALRVAQRVESGLSLADALSRTLAQCEAPVPSEVRLAQDEREADAVQRRANRPAPDRGDG